MRRLLARVTADIMLAAGLAIHERLRQSAPTLPPEHSQSVADRAEAACFMYGAGMRRARPVVGRDDN
jgi:hypothetical protein